MSKKRITDVVFTETLNDNDSLFINQNDSIKQIKKSDVLFDTLPIERGGTGATTVDEARAILGALSKSEIDEILDEVLKNYLSLSGGTMTGNPIIEHDSYTGIDIKHTTDGTRHCLRSYGAHNAIWELYNVSGDSDNRRQLILRDSSNVESALSNALVIRNYIDGSSKNYKIYGQHNVSMNKNDITAGTSELVTGDMYLVY